MGWTSGSQLAEELFDEIRVSIKEPDVAFVAFKIYQAFCQYDADDWGGTEVDRLKEKYCKDNLAKDPSLARYMNEDN